MYDFDLRANRMLLRPIRLSGETTRSFDALALRNYKYAPSTLRGRDELTSDGELTHARRSRCILVYLSYAGVHGGICDLHIFYLQCEALAVVDNRKPACQFVVVYNGEASVVSTRADHLFIHNYIRSLLNNILRPIL